MNVKGYDLLAESPIICSSNIQHDIYQVDSIDFHIWFQGECKPDWGKLKKDFTAFTKTNDLISSERTIYEASALVVGDRVKVYIKGNGFLRYMIRNIIAALINISSGKADYTIDSLLESKDNSILKDIAPASGLFLNNVEY